jgi:hypothetical protein
MDDLKSSEQPPWWARIALRHRLRRKARLLAACFSILGLISLTDAAIVSNSESISGRIAFYLQLSAGCLFSAVAIWYWLAIRWVDKKGQWLEAS